MTNYEQICRDILKEDTVRFAGLVEESGKLIAGGLKPGITMKLSQEQLDDVLREVAARVKTRKKHDRELGRVKYSASRREDVVIMSYPINENALVVVAEPNINIDRMAWRIIQILGSQWGEFAG